MPYPDDFSSRVFDHAMRENQRYEPPQIVEIRVMLAKAQELLNAMSRDAPRGDGEHFEEAGVKLAEALDDIEAGIAHVQARMEEGL